MKQIKKITLSVAAALLCIASVGTATAITAQAEEVYYGLGSTTQKAERLEAENATLNVNEGYDNALFASGKSVKYLASGTTATFTVNVEQAGDYVVKFCYYTLSSQSKLKITVNGTAQETQALPAPGRASPEIANSNNRNRVPYFYNHTVTLKAGENTIVFQNAASGITGSNAKCVDLDFVEIYPANALYTYPIERQHQGLQKVGERIEAEWGIFADATKYASIGWETGSRISGAIVGLGTNASNAATMCYKVNVEEAGKYWLVIQNTCNATKVTDPVTGTSRYEGMETKQKWTINGEEQIITYDGKYYDVAASAGAFEVTNRYEVALKAGLNTFTYTVSKNGANTDWFAITEKTDGLNTILQAEHYAFGATGSKASDKHIEIFNGYVGAGYYPAILDGFGLEFNATRAGGASIPITVAEGKAGYYDLYIRGFTGANTSSVHVSVNNGEKIALIAKNSGYISWWANNPNNVTAEDNVMRVYLNEGENEIRITKGNDYVYLDWFYVTESKMPKDYVDGMIYELDYGETLSLGEYISADEKIATVEDGVVITRGAGETFLYYEIPMNDKTNYVFRRNIPLAVNRLIYQQTERLIAEDVAVVYDGSSKELLAYAPDGWTVEYRYRDKKRVDVGEYFVTVLFIHPGYETVRKDVTLTVTKAEYTGDDLIVDNAAATYDGNEHSLTASAPNGWKIAYLNNARTNAGETLVTVVFSHAQYEDVVKTGKIKVTKANYTGDGLTVNDVNVAYDGEEHFITASAPDGWSVTYENNVKRKNVGSSIVTVTFSHENYNDVVKTATVTITQGEKEVSGGCGSVVFGGTAMAVLALGAVVSVFARKRKN